MLKKIKYEKFIGFLVGTFSLTGIIASFILTIEEIYLLKNPNFILSCSINSIFNCASVMNSWQAELFGFPNSLIGIVGYTFMGTIALHLFIDGKLSKLIALISLVAAKFATIFSYWLIWESVFTIKSLCIYCIISCVSITNIFFSLLVYCIKSEVLKLGSKVNSLVNKGYYWILISIWYLLLFTLIFVELQTR